MNLILKKKNETEIKALQKEITEIIQRDQPGFQLRPEKANQLVADLCTIWAVIPPKTNPRLIAQNGKFLIFGKNWDKTASLPDWNIQVASAVIPAPCKENILKELAQLDINEATIYPELEKNTDYLAKKILTK